MLWFPKNDSEAYDTSKAALNHLIRGASDSALGPQVRVNGIAPRDGCGRLYDVPLAIE